MQSVRHRDPDMASARAVRLGPRDFTIERKNDGTIYMRSPHRLDPYPDKLTERLVHWATRTPDTPDIIGDVAALLADPRVRAEFQQRLDNLSKEATGSSSRVVRAMLMAEPPSLDAGEATDKGSINQRNVLKNRAALVQELYDQPPSQHVITITQPKA